MSEVAVDSGLNELLYGAIQKKRLIRFRYKKMERVVEPHDYGIQNGTVRLLSWQVGGQSSGRIPGWRWFDVNTFQACEMLERSFSGNRDASGEHHQWDELFIRVDPPANSDKKAS
jgi:hypothetical protein